MLERYGIKISPTGELEQLDAQRTFEKVRQDIAGLFNTELHPSLVEFTSPEGYQETLRNLLAARGISDCRDIDLTARRIAEATEIGGATAYCGDLDIGVNWQPRYIIFLSSASKITHFPSILAEEVTHGEHFAYLIDDVGMTYDQYKENFHEISDEFLGYLGRKKIIEVTGMEGRYGTTIDASKNLTKNQWSHFLGYWIADDLLEKKKNLPYEALFKAESESQMWAILKESTDEKFVFNLNFQRNLDYLPLKQSLGEVINENNAGDYIELNFKHF